MAEHEANTSTRAARTLDPGAYSAPPKIPKVISWEPGVPRSSVPATTRPPVIRRLVNAPKRPRKNPAAVWGAAAVDAAALESIAPNNLVVKSDHRVVPTDVRAIDHHGKSRFANVVRVLTEFLAALATGPKATAHGQLDGFLPTVPADSLAGMSRYERARADVFVKVHIPGAGEARRFKLAGAMFAHGELHHYRVVSGDGEMHLVPPDWLVSPPPTLVPANEGFLLGAGS